MQDVFMEMNFEQNDNLFLASEEIIFDSYLKCFKVAMPDGKEFNASVDRLLDIF